MLKASAIVGRLIAEAAKDVLAVVGTSQGILGPQVQEKIRLRIRSLLDNVGKAYKDEMGILEMPAEDAQAVLGEFLASIMPRAAKRFPDPRQQEAVKQEISRLFNEELDKQGPWSLMQEPEDVNSPHTVFQGRDSKMNKAAGWVMGNCRFANKVLAEVLDIFGGMTKLAAMSDLSDSHRKALLKVIIKELAPYVGKAEFEAKKDALQQTLIGSLNLSGLADPKAKAREIVDAAARVLSRGTLEQQYQQSIEDANKMTRKPQNPPIA